MMDAVVTDPDICGGIPILRGTRVAVDDVVEMFKEGMSAQSIMENYDYLSESDLLDCLAYHIQHPEE